MKARPTSVFSEAKELASRMLRFGYDAIAAKAKRQPPSGLLRSEDDELNVTQRRLLLSASRDIHRNYVIAAWMIRRHLDYVTTFRFQCRGDDPALNRQIDTLMRDWTASPEFDVAGRHPLRRWLRIFEARAVLDGDVFALKTKTGQLQAIEGDRVRTPTGGLPDGLSAVDFLHGIKTDAVGRLQQLCICKRPRGSDFAPGGGTFQFERLLSAVNVHQHGYFDRFDQVRGVSPLAPALNSLRDSYEGIDYALAKAKVAQLFALALFRGDPNNPPTDIEGQDYSKIKFGEGAGILNLDPGDRAEFLESRTPSTEFQAFQIMVIQLALKALDIPFSFFSENFTNYSGARQALLQYEQSAQNRRADLVQLLDAITRWRLILWQLDGLLPAFDVDALNWEWVHASLPWLDPLKEVQADLSQLSAGLTSRRRLLKERGEEFFEVAQELAEEQQFLADLGLPTAIQPDNALIKELVKDAPAQ